MEFGNVSTAAYQQIKDLIDRYPDASFYIMDILPGNLVTRAKRNSNARKFNRLIRKSMGSHYIGGYEFLIKNGFTLIDNSHYDTATYKKIYAYILRKIRWN